MMIENGKKVKIHYTLTVDGAVIDTSRNAEPFVYQQGNGQVIPGLEHALIGLKPGDSREIYVGPDDAYGPIKPEAVLEVPRDQIPMDGLEVGQMLKGSDAEGRSLHGTIKHIGEDKVTVDFNHPLAGKELFFEIEIVDVT